MPHDDPDAAPPRAGATPTLGVARAASGEDAAEPELQRWLKLDPGPLQQLARVATSWFWDAAFRLSTHGVEHIPQDGAFLFVCNHSSYLDPFLQARAQPRRVRFMAKAEVFGWPVVGRLARAAGAFPVRRGAGDQFAMQLARELLEAGEPVAIYPEGTRHRGPGLGAPRRGAARLALETGVPVVPVAAYGTKPRHARPGAPLLPRVTTVYRPPLQWQRAEPTMERVAEVRDAIWREVEAAYEQAARIDRLR